MMKLEGCLLLRFSCGTQVIIPAERIASDAFPSLLEAPKMRSTEPNLMAIIKEWQKKPFSIKEEDFVPTSIYLASAESVKVFLQSYYLADNLAKSHSTGEVWLNDFFEFLYAVTLILHGKAIDCEMPGDMYTRMCSRFVQTLSKEIESIFFQALMKTGFSNDIIDSTLVALAKMLKRTWGEFLLQRFHLGRSRSLWKAL